MLVDETPSAICWSSARDTIATAGIVSPMLAMAEPSARLMLFCSLLMRADFAAASPSGRSTIAAITMPMPAKQARQTTSGRGPRRRPPFQNSTSAETIAAVAKEGPGRHVIVTLPRDGGAPRSVHRFESEHDLPGLGVEIDPDALGTPAARYVARAGSRRQEHAT